MLDQIHETVLHLIEDGHLAKLLASQAKPKLLELYVPGFRPRGIRIHTALTARSKRAAIRVESVNTTAYSVDANMYAVWVLEFAMDVYVLHAFTQTASIFIKIRDVLFVRAA